MKPASREGSDFNKGSEQRDDSRNVDSSSPQAFLKTKPIAKPQGDYIQFFKFHYKSLAQQHRRWSNKQIVSVIKLLWKKKKSQGKGLRKRDGRLRTSKPLSGRKYFRKTRQLSGWVAFEKWKRLPLESKHYWGNESRGIRYDNTTESRIMKFGAQKGNRNEFAFMSKNIA